MISKKILGASIAAVFAVSMLALPLGLADAAGHFLIIESASVTATPTEISKAVIDTAGKIPKKDAFVGYGVVTSSFPVDFPVSPADIVVATIHTGVLDSEKQKGKISSSAWHNHYVKIGAGPAGCASGIQVLDISHGSPGKVKIKGDKIEIKDVPLGTIGAQFGLAPNLSTSFTTGTYAGLVASFTLSGLADPTYGVAVCVDNLAPFAAP